MHPSKAHGPPVSSTTNGDGHLDLAVTAAAGAVGSVLAGNGDGAFQPTVDHAVGGGAEGIAIGDVDGDGSPDLATADFADQTVSLLVNRGDGTFLPQRVVAAGVAPSSVVIADLDRDGWPDLAYTNDDSAELRVALSTCP